jgi:hypothetical protein
MADGESASNDRVNCSAERPESNLRRNDTTEGFSLFYSGLVCKSLEIGDAKSPSETELAIQRTFDLCSIISVLYFHL